MQFWFTVARIYDLEVCNAVSSAWNALGFLLTWQTSILSLVSRAVSSPRKLSVLLPALNKLSDQTDEVSAPVIYFQRTLCPCHSICHN